MSRLLVVDDHSMLAEGLAMRLATLPDLWVVGQCSTGDRRLAGLVTNSRPDVVTVDVEPLGSAAGDLVRWLTRKRPSIGVVVLTGRHDPKLAVDVARAGAAAWVPKTCGTDTLVDVLRGVCVGDAWYPPDLLGAVLRELWVHTQHTRRRIGPLDVLSDREHDVLLGMVRGKRGSEIAQDLLISGETVRTHIRSILAKLRVHSQLEAVSLACAAGLRPDDGTVPPQGQR